MEDDRYRMLSFKEKAVAESAKEKGYITLQDIRQHYSENKDVRAVVDKLIYWKVLNMPVNGHFSYIQLSDSRPHKDVSASVTVDRLTSGVSAGDRDVLNIIRDSLTKLSTLFGKRIKVDTLADLVSKSNVDEKTFNMLLEKMRSEGEVFMPKEGFVQKM